MKLFHHIGIKAATVMLAAGGLGFGLVGSGVHAAFTDKGTATVGVSVGTFGIKLATSSANCTADGSSQAWTVTCAYPAGTVIGSAAGSFPVAFTVQDTGTIPGHFNVAAGVITGQVAGATQFTDLLAPVVNQAIAAGATSAPINAGLSWAELVNLNEGQMVSITYAVTANA